MLRVRSARCNSIRTSFKRSPFILLNLFEAKSSLAKNKMAIIFVHNNWQITKYASLRSDEVAKKEKYEEKC